MKPVWCCFPLGISFLVFSGSSASASQRCSISAIGRVTRVRHFTERDYVMLKPGGVVVLAFGDGFILTSG